MPEGRTIFALGGSFLLDFKLNNLDRMLIEAGCVGESVVREAVEKSSAEGIALERFLVRENIVYPEEILRVIESTFNIDYVDLEEFDLTDAPADLVSGELATETSSVPLMVKGGKLVVAMADPLNVIHIEEMKKRTGLGITPVFSGKGKVAEAIRKVYQNQSIMKELDELGADVVEESSASYDEEDEDSVIIRTVNSIIDQAVEQKASDIHVEPFEDHVLVRLRIDGQLREVMKLARSSQSAIATRVKLLAKLDITEKRLPQDGRINLNMDGIRIDLRVSATPTIHGEKLVLRLISRESYLIEKDSLGMNQDELRSLDSIINKKSGLILVAGPTGSGKSTTLYSILKELNSPDVNIMTAEDPVEYRIEGINQIQVKSKIGLEFSNILRSMLRQDPDILMIGEIRDEETARLAITASVTGHLVLSTIHTDDCASTIARLIDMGIEKYMIVSSLAGVVSQRLYRINCENCKRGYFPTAAEAQALNIDRDTTLFKSEGCRECSYTGYKGRGGVYEILRVDEDIRVLISEGRSIDSVRAEMSRKKISTLRESVRRKVIEGSSSFKEYLRLTGLTSAAEAWGDKDGC